MKRQTAIQGAGKKNDPYLVTPGQLAKCILFLAKIRRPYMCWGPPGIGKSALNRSLSKRIPWWTCEPCAKVCLDYACRGCGVVLEPGDKRIQVGAQYKDIRGTTLAPEDFRGIPFIRKGEERTRWAPPVFLPPEESRKAYMIHFDEISSLTPMLEVAVYQLILEREMGEYTLPEGVFMGASGNRAEDRAVASRMSTALANRMIHFDVRADIDEWLVWAAENGLSVDVTFFLSIKRKLLFQFDPDSEEHAFPSPRTWEFTSDMVQANREGEIGPELFVTCLRGTIGEGAAIEFDGYLQIKRQIQHPTTIFSDPKKALIPKDPSVLLATCGALVDYVSKDTMKALVTYAMRADMRPEVGQFTIGQAVLRNTELQETRAYAKWLESGRA